MLILIWCLSILLWHVPGCAAERVLTFLHFNDIYEINAKEGVGGVAALMTALQQERRQSPESVTIVSGDFLSPSPLASITQGKHMVALFNAVGVDIVGFGNHEFDFGLAPLKARMQESSFQWLGSNIATNLRELDDSGMKPYLLQEIGGLKVGFLGLLTPATRELSPGGKPLRIEDPIETAKRMVPQLHNMGADIVVVITHLDMSEDVALAKSVKGIDLILGGHNHTPRSHYENGVLILKSGTDGEYLGVVKLHVELQECPHKVTKVVPGWCMRPIYGLQPEDCLSSMVAAYSQTLKDAMQQPVTKAAFELDGRNATVRGKESSLADVFADALKETYDADIALMNGGLIRGNRLYPAGSVITRGDILLDLPMHNIAVLIEITGKELLEILEHGFSKIEELSGRFPQVSGMRVYYAPAAPVGKRVTKVLVAGAPLELAKTYRLATTNYLLQGGDGYTSLSHARVIKDEHFGSSMTEIVLDYAAQHKLLKPLLERLIIDSSPPSP